MKRTVLCLLLLPVCLALGPAAWAAACGSVPVASFTVTKLAWLRENEPDVFAAVRQDGGTDATETAPTEARRDEPS